MIQIRRILCPVDFSPFARRALDHAAVLSRWYEAEITVLHVSPTMPAVFGLEPMMTEAALAPFDREGLGRELLTFAGDTVEMKPTPQLVVKAGSPVRTILEYAAEMKADLIVVGTHGRTGFERLMLGSVTEKVVRRAPCPVLTVPRRAEDVPERPPFGRILCGVDFSDASQRAAEYALSLAQEAEGHLSLVHVVESLPDGLASYPGFDLNHYRSTTIADARLKLDELVTDEVRNWIEPDTKIVMGKPYQELLRLASDDRSDLIVLGVNGRAIDRMIFGSTAQAVVRQATCPVLTIRP